MKNLLLSFFVLLTSFFVNSQVSSYTPLITSGTYTTITGTSILGNVDDGNAATTNIGFTFTLGGQTFTQFRANSNGHIRLGATAATSNYAPLSTTSNTYSISAAGADGRSTGGVIHTVTGSAPNRVSIIQYTGYRLVYNATTATVSFQIRLYETTNVVEIIYTNATGTTTSRNVEVGLRGSTTTADVRNYSGSNNGWATLTAGTTSTSTIPWGSNQNTTRSMPSNGRILRWTPPVIPVCSGTPTPGNTIASSATVTAPSGNVNLSLQNATTGTGVTYQWELSTTSSTTGFSNISGATLSTYTPTVTTNTWFRCVVTCSGNSGISTPIQITLSYCTPTATTDDATGLTFVGFNTISNTTTGTSAYTDFTSQSTSLDQGGSYSLTTRVNTAGDFTVNVKSWIDWNQNLIFDVSEEYNLGSANNISDGITTLSPLVVAVGSSQAAGNYRMRIRATYNVLPTACGNQNYSETEDYTIVVVVPPPCSGTPNPGNTISSSLTTPPNGTVNLSLQNTTTGTGVTYVWESSPDNSTWTIFGSSSSTQTSPPITSPTWFRSTVTCAGNSGISTPIQITLSYCTYNITNNDATGITSVAFGTISNTSLGGPSYSDFTTQSTTVEQGGIYQLNVNVNTDGNWTVNTKVWIDWNQNYEFEVGEEYSLGSAINTANGITSLSPLNITVPIGATLGETRMRIVSVESSDLAPLSCGTQLYGEAEDYKLSIIPPTGLPVELLYFEGVAYATHNTLKWSTASEHNSDYFQIERSIDGVEWKTIGTKTASGNSNTKIDYSFIDSFDDFVINYYRLVQVDYDGQYKIYGPISLDNTKSFKKVVKYINLLGQEVNLDIKGFIFEVYEDGTMRKIIR
jgi:hypothetical protein